MDDLTTLRSEVSQIRKELDDMKRIASANGGPFRSAEDDADEYRRRAELAEEAIWRARTLAHMARAKVQGTGEPAFVRADDILATLGTIAERN